MSRSRLLPAVLMLALGAACSSRSNSLAPSPLTAAAGLAAKPGGSGPAATPHDVGFTAPPDGGPGDDGLPSPGYLDGAGVLNGWITGSSGAGNLVANASGTFTFTVTDVAPLPSDVSTGDPCTESDQSLLRSAGLIGAPVTGALTVSVDQDGTPSFRGPQLTWDMANVAAGDGNTWKLSGLSTVNFLPSIQGDSTGLTVRLDDGKLNFVRYPAGSRKSDLVVGCRVDLLMTMRPR